MVERDHIRLEILQGSHLEHYKAERDLSMVLPIDHPKRMAVRKSAEELGSTISKLKGQKWERSSRR